MFVCLFFVCLFACFPAIPFMYSGAMHFSEGPSTRKYFFLSKDFFFISKKDICNNLCLIHSHQLEHSVKERKESH